MCKISKTTFFTALFTVFLFAGTNAFAEEASVLDFSQQNDAERNLFPKDAVILFQGDSVTDGNRGRSADPNHIHGHGYVYLIASYLGAKYPEQNWTFVNRGVSGNTLEDLKKRWEKDTVEIHPDVLCIMVGVNDFGRGFSSEEYEKNYDELLQKTREALPNVRLVLMEPLWRQSDDAVKAEYQKIVREMAVRYNAVFIPLQEDFNTAFASTSNPKYWVWDSVHPTTVGHWRVFRAWLETMCSSKIQQ